MKHAMYSSADLKNHSPYNPLDVVRVLSEDQVHNAPLDRVQKTHENVHKVSEVERWRGEMEERTLSKPPDHGRGLLRSYELMFS
jgi:uncharacterized protein related to proFAR isomerase